MRHCFKLYILFYVIDLFIFFRLISYLFHAHKKRWVYRKVSFKDFNADFIHSIVVKLLEKVNKCLKQYEELACVYMYSSSDGNLDVSIISTESHILILLILCIVVSLQESRKHQNKSYYNF